MARFGIFERVTENTIGKYCLQKQTINHISFMSNHRVYAYTMLAKKIRIQYKRMAKHFLFQCSFQWWWSQFIIHSILKCRNSNGNIQMRSARDWKFYGHVFTLKCIALQLCVRFFFLSVVFICQIVVSWLNPLHVRPDDASNLHTLCVWHKSACRSGQHECKFVSYANFHSKYTHSNR